MNAALWVLQVLLAVVFAAHGWMLLFPPPDLLVIMNEEMGEPFRLFLGAAEVLGAIGVVLPALTRVMQWLTSVSAACLGFVVLSATVWHLARGEFSSALITAVLTVMAVGVAYGRWRVRPIRPRQLATA
jgi:uncharacterized membrane protein YphA (DoxX/SURF4 family)